MAESVIKDIRVTGVEKPRKGTFQEHFEYVIKVTYENGREHVIFRRYSMLFDFHTVLKQVVEDSYQSVLILPELPVARFYHCGLKLLGLGMNKELKQMTEYCQKIKVLLKVIAEKDVILKFFDQLETDVIQGEAYQEVDTKKQENLAKDQTDRNTNELVQDQYVSIEDFHTNGVDELSVKKDEVVTVIEKNASGWWLVSNEMGVTGFAPATYLQHVDGQNIQDEWQKASGPNDIYTAISSYKAQSPDEISFQVGDEVEILAISKTGWWKVRFNGMTGLCPSSTLAIKDDSCYYEDPMNVYRKSIMSSSKKYSQRRTPPRTGSSKSIESQIYESIDDYKQVEPERFTPPHSVVKYTKIIPKNLRKEHQTQEPNNNQRENSEIKYVNVPVIKNGTPHYLDGQKAEAINVHVTRKDYYGNGLSLRQGEMVQVMSVMPDGLMWKVATLNPPYKEGLIPSDLLCPELLHPSNESLDTQCSIEDDTTPLKVLPRFTSPPSVRKPIPVPRTVVRAGINAEQFIKALVDYNSGHTDLLKFQKGDTGRLVKKTDTGWWFIELKGVEGWVPAMYWCRNDRECIDEKNLEISRLGGNKSWFCGKMSREECEDLFEKRGKHLDFILRESVQRVSSYALSIKFIDKVHHFPIEISSSGKFLIGRLSFDRLSEIVIHYSVHPLFYTENKQPVSIGKPLSRV